MAYTHREWYLFIGLLVAIFLVFALWSSKKIIEVSRLPEEKPEVTKVYEASPGSPGPVIEEVELVEHDISTGEFDEMVSKKLDGITHREEMCRLVLEEIYQLPFPKMHPEFLRNDRINRNISADIAEESISPRLTKRKLELDGYNEELGIAFECNGKFHYKPHAFTLSQKEHKYQLWKDHFKAQQCNRHDVYLISIPYTINKRDIPSFIKSRLPHKMQERYEAGRPDFTDDFAMPSYHMGDSELEGSVTYSASYIQSRT